MKYAEVARIVAVILQDVLPDNGSNPVRSHLGSNRCVY